MLTFIVASMLMKLDGVGMQGYKGCRVAGIQGGGGGGKPHTSQCIEDVHIMSCAVVNRMMMMTQLYSH